MSRFLRLIIWDALFFTVLTGGYAVTQAVKQNTNAVYLVSVLTCLVCGAFLAQLAGWGIGWMELIFVGLPAAYLAAAPFLAALLTRFSVPFPLIPTPLLKSSALSLRLSCAAAAGFVVWGSRRIK